MNVLTKARAATQIVERATQIIVVTYIAGIKVGGSMKLDCTPSGGGNAGLRSASFVAISASANAIGLAQLRSE
jgi:hypothetical protein